MNELNEIQVILARHDSELAEIESRYASGEYELTTALRAAAQAGASNERQIQSICNAELQTALLDRGVSL